MNINDTLQYLNIGLPDDIARAGLLAGLYHDCGRFPQFCQYRTFVDAASVNHAHLSLSLIHI